jgi:capsular exopolysaccharide synthesis family protein
MNPSPYIRAIHRSWWIVALSIFIGGIASAGLSYLTPAKFETRTTFFVKTASDSIATSAQGDTFGQKRVNTYVQLVKTERLAMLVKQQLGGNIEPDHIRDAISASADPNTVLLNVSVTDTEPETSLRVAEAVGAQFVAMVRELESSTGIATSPVISLEVVDGPTLNPDPVSPKPVRNIILGVILGLIAGLLLAFLREVIDNTVRTAEDLLINASLPTLALIPLTRKPAAANVNMSPSRESAHYIEAIKQLRTSIQFANAVEGIRVLAITSPSPGEGKSQTAVSLAIAFAEAGSNTILVDADLRRPRIAAYLGLEGAAGLTNVLANQVELELVLQPWGDHSLRVLPSGSIPPNPSELLGSQRMRELIVTLGADCDLVIIDCPPVLPVADAAVLASYADGVALVVKFGSTTRAQLHRTSHILETARARKLGGILNMVPLRSTEAYSGDPYGYTDPAPKSLEKKWAEQKAHPNYNERGPIETAIEE